MEGRHAYAQASLKRYPGGFMQEQAGLRLASRQMRLSYCFALSSQRVSPVQERQRC